MDNLKDGIYVLDIRTKPIANIIEPEGGIVITLSDGRQAIISPDRQAAQIVL